MKNKIQQELSKLIGYKLIGSSRTLNMQMFHFDMDDSAELGKFAIHILCEWRMLGNGLYAGSQDIRFNQSGDYDSNIDWGNETYRDRLLTEMLKRNSFIVQDVSADDFGGFELIFQRNVKLQVLPMSASKDLNNEYWRIFEPRQEIAHFVVTSRGIQE